MKQFDSSVFFLVGICLATVATAYAQNKAQQFSAPPIINKRPQLTPEQANAYSYAEVLKYTGQAGSERTDPWDPLSDALTQSDMPTPDYLVDQTASVDGVHVFNTVQAAVSRAATDSKSLHRARLFILIRPGVYHELLYVPATSIPITLYGGDNDAAQTVISANLNAAVSGDDYVKKFAAQFAAVDPGITAMYSALKNKPVLDTVGTATVWVKNDGFQAKNITFENAYRPDCSGADCAETAQSSGKPVIHHQAVALMVDGADKVQFENVRLLGLQDTLYLKSSAIAVTTRSFFNHAYIEGDVDFIFGDTTGYFYQSEIKSLGDRKTSYVTAPATNYRTKFGLVFNACKFTNDGSLSALAGQFYLGRQWFHSQKCTPYGPIKVAGYACRVGDVDGYVEPLGTISKNVLETVGKVVIMNSRIGAHINSTHPWSDWNSYGTLAYRPAQFSSDDYWRNLISAGIDPVATLRYSERKIPAEPFLAEFNNWGK